MSHQSVICLAHSRLQAELIVDDLRSAGFSSDDISALLADHGTSRDFAHEMHTKAPEGTAAGAGVGGLVGGTLGWLAGIGALAIPGVGPLIAAGPIMAALSGAAVGATVGGLTGCLIGLGIPEIEARRYEDKLRQGNVLIAVHAEDSRDVSRAKDIFERAEASDICVSSEKT